MLHDACQPEHAEGLGLKTTVRTATRISSLDQAIFRSRVMKKKPHRFRLFGEL